MQVPALKDQMSSLYEGRRVKITHDASISYGGKTGVVRKSQDSVMKWDLFVTVDGFPNSMLGFALSEVEFINE